MSPSRRTLLKGALGSLASITLPRVPGAQERAAGSPIRKRIPSSGEFIPCVGLGTWITFNVGEDPKLRNECAAVMEAFFQAGGRMIDSSPMYGSSQSVVGHGLDKLDRLSTVFSTDKVWTSSGDEGAAQIEQSRRHWKVPRFDLMQVHNLVAWEPHLQMLLDMKAAGRLDYVGITTSEGRRHDLFERVMRAYPLDFIQVTYNIVDREVEDRILPLAEERGMAVIANRPFRQKALIRRLDGKPLPEWADEIEAESWAQFILKYIVSHPAITVAIPATTRVDHVRENLAAASAPLPDQAMRRRMAEYVQGL